MHTRSVALWSLPEDVLVETGLPEGSVQLLTRWGVVRLEDPGPAALESLRRMRFGPVSLDNVVAGAAEPGAGPSLAELMRRLEYVVIRTLSLDDGSGQLLSVVPITQQATFPLRPVGAGARIRLARLAALHRTDDGPVLESVLADHRVLVHHPLVAALVTKLAGPATVASLAAAVDRSVDLVQDIVGYLVAAGMVVIEGGESGPAPLVAEHPAPRS